MGKRNVMVAWLLAVGTVLVVSACGGSGVQTAEETAVDPPTLEAPSEIGVEAETVGGGGVESDPQPTAPPFESYYARALAGEFTGKVVTMFGPVTDREEVLLNAVLDPFEKATGIDVQYEGSREFEATIAVRVAGGDPPDIADFPQPALLENFAQAGALIDLNRYFEPGYLEGQYDTSWLEMATVTGPDGPIMAGVWHRINGKSLVWYPKAQFEAAGYVVPESWDELLALTEQIAADGRTPWCVGIESGVATGWTATDWTEEIMLRTTSLESYDAWVRGELGFDSPEVRTAIETWSEIWLNPEYVYGGPESIVTTSFTDAPAPLFEDPPGCWLHKQGGFIVSFFPEDAEPLVDYDFFYLPPIDAAYGEPHLVAGDIYGAFTDRPEVLALMEYFSTGESLRPWMEAGGVLAPHSDANLDWYGDPIERRISASIRQATSVRFDGSDLMPSQVGSGSFWRGMIAYISGTADLETVLREIDASWPR